MFLPIFENKFQNIKNPKCKPWTHKLKNQQQDRVHLRQSQSKDNPSNKGDSEATPIGRIQTHRVNNGGDCDRTRRWLTAVTLSVWEEIDCVVVAGEMQRKWTGFVSMRGWKRDEWDEREQTEIELFFFFYLILIDCAYYFNWLWLILK